MRRLPYYFANAEINSFLQKYLNVNAKKEVVNDTQIIINLSTIANLLHNFEIMGVTNKGHFIISMQTVATVWFEFAIPVITKVANTNKHTN